jgi:hypothetical protein
MLIFISVVIGLTFYNASVIAELVRAGVGSLPSGQREAGLAIGMTPNQTLAIVLLPQAITAMLPSMISQLVVILKDSALGYWINYLELLNQAKSFGTYQANTIPALIVAAAIYIVLNYGLSRLASVVEYRLKTRSKGGAPLAADTMTGPDAAVGVNTGGRVASAPDLPGGLGRPGLPDHRDLDLTGVGQLLLDLLGDVAGPAPGPRCRRPRPGAPSPGSPARPAWRRPCPRPSRAGRSPPAAPAAGRTPRCSPAGLRDGCR